MDGVVPPTNPHQPPPIAMDTVFHLPELVEVIISQMPINDLIAATAVRQQWQDLIFRSHSMQARLLLDPLPKATDQNDIAWNQDGGAYWLARLQPSEDDSESCEAADLLIYRTPQIHIELLLPHAGGQPIVIDSKKTQICQREMEGHILKEAHWYDASGRLRWSSLLEQTTHRGDGSALTVYLGDDGKFHFGQRLTHRWRVDGKCRVGSESNTNIAVMLAYLRTHHGV